MTVDIRTEKPSDRELVLACTFDAPPEMVYRAWTEPALLKRWFAPRPYETPVAELDVRAGGACRIVMRGPDGQEYPCPGVYLEVVENRRLIMTDAYTAAWEPAAKPFMTTILSFEKDGGRTRYTARVLHWSAEDCDAHERMGFHEGWSQAARQLAEVVATL